MTAPRAVFAGPPGVDWWAVLGRIGAWVIVLGSVYFLAHVICAIMTGSL